MKRLVKGPLAVAVIMLSIFVLAGVGNVWAVPCGVGTLKPICGCGDTVMGNFTFIAPLNCTGVAGHGLIVGAAGIIIDGAGFALIGGGVAGRDCNCANFNGSGCDEHPCRDSVDSGIFNAVDPDGAGAGVCTTGHNNVTVRNLEITGWCDGIFMSGTCSVPGDLGPPYVPPIPGVWLQDILIEDNEIHHNGEYCTDCFNDGIFLANVGRPDPTPPGYNNDWCGGNYNEVLVQGNTIYEQDGHACEECAGGSGINYNGGIEDPLNPNHGADQIDFAGCGTLTNNVIHRCAFSGIMITHATRYNQITHNDCSHNGFGGIAVPCDYSDGSYYDSNMTKQNKGPGIGVNCGGDITNNCSCLNETKEDVGDNVDFIFTGYGIWASAGKDYLNQAGINIDDNKACQNNGGEIDPVTYNQVTFHVDIGYDDTANYPYNGDGNQCYKTDCAAVDTNAYSGAVGVGGCQYRCGKRTSLCFADLDENCVVNMVDLTALNTQWNFLHATCCPSGNNNPW